MGLNEYVGTTSTFNNLESLEEIAMADDNFEKFLYKIFIKGSLKFKEAMVKDVNYGIIKKIHN